MSEDNLCHLISPVIADELRISPDADVACVLTVRCRTVAALARTAQLRHLFQGMLQVLAFVGRRSGFIELRDMKLDEVTLKCGCTT